jgi:hypothetical protein
MAMNKQEAAKLLSLIKLSYPTSYRDIDKETANATVNMWQMSFPDMPYPIMEQAFNHYRMSHKFPPTVAEMVEELQHIYYQALEQYSMQKMLGNLEAAKQFDAVMYLTARYKDTYHLGGLNMTKLQGAIGGEDNVQRLGASGDYLRSEDRLPFLDSGRGD